MKTTLAQKIATLRRQHGMTLEELGNKVDVGKSTVRKWETGVITTTATVIRTLIVSMKISVPKMVTIPVKNWVNPIRSPSAN